MASPLPPFPLGPCVLTGIEELATRADLLDRSLVLHQPNLKNHLTEKVFWAAFETARPRILGALLDAVAAASWDSVIFDVGQQSLVRVPTLEPMRGSKAHVAELLDRCPSAQALVDELLGRSPRS